MYATLHIYRFQRTCSDCALIQKLLMSLREKINLAKLHVLGACHADMQICQIDLSVKMACLGESMQANMLVMLGFQVPQHET